MSDTHEVPVLVTVDPADAPVGHEFAAAPLSQTPLDGFRSNWDLWQEDANTLPTADRARAGFSAALKADFAQFRETLRTNAEDVKLTVPERDSED